jgi:hypothetical protein
MAFQSSSDFIALLRKIGTLQPTLERMPPIDFVTKMLAEVGFISVYIGATAPTVSQPTTLWFRPATPSYFGNGALFAWDHSTSQYLPITPTLFITYLLVTVSSGSTGSVTRRQLFNAMRIDGTLLTVSSAINVASAEWVDFWAATDILKTDPLGLKIKTTLAYSDAQMDALWNAAALLPR